MRTKIISGIQIIILLLISIGLVTVLAPCGGEKVMKCAHSVNAVKLLFVTIIIVKGIQLFATEQAGIYFDIFSILLLIDTVLIPARLIGGCQMADMACRALSFPGIYVVSALLILINVITLLLHLPKKTGKDNL